MCMCTLYVPFPVNVHVHAAVFVWGTGPALGPSYVADVLLFICLHVHVALCSLLYKHMQCDQAQVLGTGMQAYVHWPTVELYLFFVLHIFSTL